MYTFGLGTSGQLGHGNKNNGYLPQVIEGFAAAGIEIVDVAVGDAHTLALTSKGEVYSFGRGDGNYLRILFREDISPLGLESTDSADTPQRVSAGGLGGKQVISIAAGPDYSYAVCKTGEVYCWGQGKDSVFCGDSVPRRLPELNHALEGLRKKKGLTVQSIKVAGRQVFALMTNGQLYSWGNNLSGNLGTKKNYLVVGEFMTESPKLVSSEKVKQLDVGSNTLVFLTGNSKSIL